MDAKKAVLDVIPSDGSIMVNRIVASLQGTFSEESITQAVNELIEEQTILMDKTGLVTLA